MSLVIKVACYCDEALEVIKQHLKESKKFKNKMQLKIFGVKQELVGNTLFITFSKLMEKIIKKGGQYNGVDDLKKNDLVLEIDKLMKEANVTKLQYEVIIDE